MEVMSGSEEKPLNVIRPCGMEISLNKVLDTRESLHLTMDYLLRDECRDFES